MVIFKIVRVCQILWLEVNVSVPPPRHTKSSNVCDVCSQEQNLNIFFLCAEKKSFLKFSGTGSSKSMSTFEVKKHSLLLKQDPFLSKPSQLMQGQIAHLSGLNSQLLKLNTQWINTTEPLAVTTLIPALGLQIMMDSRSAA